MTGLEIKAKIYAFLPQFDWTVGRAMAKLGLTVGCSETTVRNVLIAGIERGEVEQFDVKSGYKFGYRLKENRD